MKKIFKLLFLLVLTVLVLTGCFKSGEKVYRSIKVYDYSGTVNITRNDKNVDIYKDIRLKSDDYLETKNDSYALIKLDDDKFIYMYENSKIQIVATNKQKTLTRINVLDGKIVSEVKNKLGEDEEFEAAGSNSCMSIRGTYFAVEVIEDSDTNEIITTYSLVKGKTLVDAIEKSGITYKGYRFDQDTHTKISVRADKSKIVSPDKDIKYTPTSTNPREYRSDVNTVLSSILTDREENELLSVGVKFNENNKNRITAINALIAVDNTENQIYETKEVKEVTLNSISIYGYEFKHFALIDLNKNDISVYDDSLLDTIEYQTLADNSVIELNSNYIVVGIYEEVLTLTRDFDDIRIYDYDIAIEGSNINEYLKTVSVGTFRSNEADASQVIEDIKNKFVKFSINDSDVSLDDVFSANNEYEMNAEINYNNTDYSSNSVIINVAKKNLGTLGYNDYDYDLIYDFDTKTLKAYLQGVEATEVISNNKLLATYYSFNLNNYIYAYYDGETYYSDNQTNIATNIVFVPNFSNIQFVDSDELNEYYKNLETKPYYIKIEL